jgi:hypothetical protein
MNRRENLKLLFTGASGLLISACGVDQANTALVETPKQPAFSTAGRTPEEIAIDKKLFSETFFTDTEREKIEYLVDLIIPADETSAGAKEAGVPDFIEFMMKDMPYNQTRMRGGLKWLDLRAEDLFENEFMALTEKQRIAIIDEIAYPEQASKEVTTGVKFFNMLRDLTATGFFTSKIGIEDLGYAGNRPNVWEGVPDHVMAKYGVETDPKYADLYLKPEQRGIVAQWDDDGNLIG